MEFHGDFGRAILDCELNFNEKIWDQNYELLEEYQSRNNSIPSHFIIYKDIKIGGWCSKQRHKKKNNKLTKLKIKRMEKIPGWKWNRADKWNELYDLVIEYQSLNNSIPLFELE